MPAPVPAPVDLGNVGADVDAPEAIADLGNAGTGVDAIAESIAELGNAGADVDAEEAIEGEHELVDCDRGDCDCDAVASTRRSFCFRTGAGLGERAYAADAIVVSSTLLVLLTLLLG